MWLHVDEEGLGDVGIDSVDTRQNLYLIIPKLAPGELFLLDFGKVGKVITKNCVDIGVTKRLLEGLDVESEFIVQNKIKIATNKTCRMVVIATCTMDVVEDFL